MIRFVFCILCILCAINIAQSQNYVLARFDEIDYLAYKYKYLDKNYKIHINSNVFDQAVEKYKFYPEKIRNYSDSLAVVMMLEFDDWQKCNFATNVVAYQWARLSYHLWMTEDETRKFAGSFGIHHPWKFKLFLMDEANKNKIVTDFFEDLKIKISNKNPKVKFDGLNRDKILSLAARLNPERIISARKDAEARQKEAAAYEKTHGKVDQSKSGAGCGKEDCCRKPVIQNK